MRLWNFRLLLIIAPGILIGHNFNPLHNHERGNEDIHHHDEMEIRDYDYEKDGHPMLYYGQK